MEYYHIWLTCSVTEKQQIYTEQWIYKDSVYQVKVLLAIQIIWEKVFPGTGGKQYNDGSQAMT